MDGSLFYQYFLLVVTMHIQLSPHFEDEFEDIPCEFDMEQPHLTERHESVKFQSNLGQKQQTGHITPKRNTKEYLNKTSQYIANKQHKIDQLKVEFESRAMADCTFKPHINRSKSKSARNLKQFLDCQNKHLAKIDEKTSTLKQRIEQQNRRTMTFSPQINPKKYEKNKQNVHERLYKLKDKDKDHYAVIYNHIPKITERGEKMVRNMPIDELLYLDAKRRAEKQFQIPQAQEKIKCKDVNKEKFAAQKFLKDFRSALINLELFDQKEYDQEQFCNILRELGFSKHTQEINNILAQQERKLVKQAYQYLEQFAITQINLYIFLLAVGGIYDIDLNNEEVNDILVIDEEQGRKVHNYFESLFRNRLFSDYSKKTSRTPPKEENSFKPTINPDSENLAQRYRGKMIDRANGIFARNDINIKVPDKGLSHSDLLVIYNLGQNLQKQKQRQHKMLEKDPQCTFQPNAEKYSYQHMNQTTIGVDKCQELYQNARVKQAELNKVSAFNTYNTFEDQSTSRKQLVSPKTPNYKHPIPIPKSNIKSYMQIKDVDKTLKRMAEGRQIRNQKRQYQERGELQTKKQQCSRIMKQSGIQTFKPHREVLLDVDVSINNINKKIQIYKGEQHQVLKVVEKFVRDNHLDFSLRKILEIKLINAIKKMHQANLRSDL